jgi:predicted transcriptional regulator of viral defense system
MRRSTAPRDVRLAQLAARQYAIVNVRQLGELGFDEAAIRRRVVSGRLHRLYRGVYAIGHTVLNAHAGGWRR